MTGNASAALVERLAWDSDHFGFPVARVSSPTDQDRIREAAGVADEAGIRCLMALVAAGQTPTVTAAENIGFRCYDVRIELARDVRMDDRSLDVLGVRLGTEADLPALAPIARTRFSASRFSADPHFPDDLVGELYVSWLRRALATEDRLLVVANDLDGFVVCHLDGETRMGTVELIAVAVESEGTGLGSRLVHGADAVFAHDELTRARVVTQGCNLQAQRLYQHHGYCTCSVELWLHRWALSR